MLTCGCVNRLLTILEGRPDRKVKTAIYVTKSMQFSDLRHYVRQYLDDESYISRGGYKFEYSEDNIFIETSSDYKFFEDVLSRGYEAVFMITGEENDEIKDIINSLSDENNTIFIAMDCKLRAYKYLDEKKQKKFLKRKAS